MQAPQLPRQPPTLSAFGVTPAPPQPSTLLGIPLSGTVDSQFDAGYFVTIHAGTQEFRGESCRHWRAPSGLQIYMSQLLPFEPIEAAQCCGSARGRPGAMPRTPICMLSITYMRRHPPISPNSGKGV